MIYTLYYRGSNATHLTLIYLILLTKLLFFIGCLRIDTFIYSNVYLYESMTCQKIFYHEQSVVNLKPNVDPNIELGNYDCF